MLGRIFHMWAKLLNKSFWFLKDIFARCFSLEKWSPVGPVNPFWKFSGCIHDVTPQIWQPKLLTNNSSVKFCAFLETLALRQSLSSKCLHLSDSSAFPKFQGSSQRRSGSLKVQLLQKFAECHGQEVNLLTFTKPARDLQQKFLPHVIGKNVSVWTAADKHEVIHICQDIKSFLVVDIQVRITLHTAKVELLHNSRTWSCQSLGELFKPQGARFSCSFQTAFWSG